MGSRARSCQLAILTLAATTAGVDAREESTWEHSAAAELRETLTRAHPEVSEWIVTSRASARQQEFLPKVEPYKTNVIHVGSRSAVLVEWLEPRRQWATIWFVTKGMRQVVVAAEDIETGATLDPTSARSASGDVMALACAPIAEVDALKGMRAMRSLRHDAVICEEDIAPKPPVARGERVKASVQAGNVVINGEAIAQEDGQIGDRLKVRNPSTRSTYVARVKGEQQVIVQ